MQGIVRYARRVKYSLLVLALAAYALAYYTWTLGQTPAAVVVAVFGYVVLRSRAKLCYELTCRHFRRQPAAMQLLVMLDADSLAQGESVVRRRLQESEVETFIDE
ncbi:MAG: hypothetical protein OET44_06450 [Gammaproteobacteria bacterium]|nr:hypothetical protein [Gammaproteobacteria bacterium]